MEAVGLNYPESVDIDQAVWNFDDLCERMNDAGDDEATWLKKLPYDKFLQTEYWDTVRYYKLYLSGYACERCGARPKFRDLHIHHKYYDHHGREHEYLQDLMVLCKNCHESEHHKHRVKSDLLHVSLLKRLPPILAILFGERR